MGRGKKRQGSIAAAPHGAHAAHVEAPEAASLSIEGLLDNKRGIGEVITVAGGELVVDAETNALIARGLSQVMSITSRPDGLFFVRFHDGSKALLDLDGLRVAFSDGVEPNDPRLLGALARAAVPSSYDERDAEAAAATAKMGLYLSDPSSPSNLRTAAQAAESRLRLLDGELQINDPELYAKIGPLEEPAVTRPDLPLRSPLGLEFDLALARAEVNKVTTAEGGEMSENMKQLKGMIFGWKPEENRPAEINQALVEMGDEAAETLDEPVVDDAFIDDLYLNETLTQALGSLFERYALGQRTFGAMGYPGTGKDTLFRTAAALLKRPMITFNGGKGIQLQEWVGGEALIPHEVRDESGKLITAFNISAVQYGKLTRALQTASVVHISEIRGMEDQFLAAHDMLGSGIGSDATERFLRINSPHGTETINVHPHCLICFSWNPDADDWRPHDATMRRMGMFCFDPLSKEEEAERMAAMANNILTQQPSFPEFHEKPFTGKDLIPIAEFAQRFQKAVEAEADEISSAPSPQLFSYFFTDVVLKAANQAASTDDASASDQAIQWSLSMLEAYLNQTMPRAERKKKLTMLLGNARGPLDDLVKHVRKVVTEGTA